jgi:tetratricopeptide (TPR) repeat protein
MVFANPAARTAADPSGLALEQARIAIRTGDQIEARRVLGERLVHAPRDSAALAMLAEMERDSGRIGEAEALLRRAAFADPSPVRHLALLEHLNRFAGPAAVIEETNRLPESSRRLERIRAIEAAALGVVGQHEREIAIYEAMTAEDANNEVLWKSLGDAYKTVGRTDQAVAALRKAIEIRPDYGEAYWTLANFKSVSFDEHDLAAMKRMVRRSLAGIDLLHFHFALGKAFEDLQRWSKSFDHYAAGNKIRAREMTPAQMTLSPSVDRAIAAETPAFFARPGAPADLGSEVILIVGLQRSGSTLIEQILSSHSAVEGTTELTFLHDIAVRLSSIAPPGRSAHYVMAQLDPPTLAALGEEYLARCRPFRLEGRDRFIDKLPANWLNLGLIRRILPGAKIIDARRHPMACGFSNFKQHYASGVSFAYSQESIGRFYLDYWRTMRHFDQVQPGAVHRVINERLIDDPESEIRALLDYLGLPFEQACLDFHKNKRAVRTPSAEQVRRPLNRDGVDLWRNYEQWLGPMKAALGPALEKWDSD